MEAVMTVLADEHQALMGAIGIAGMSTHRASLAGVVGIHFDRHRTLQERFIGNHAVQLSKSPLGIGSVGTSLLLAHLFAMLAPSALADICQLFQSNQAVRVSGHDTLRDYMIGVLLQPSLSSANGDQAPCSRASAFLLQTLPQSRIMVGFGDDLLPGMEGTVSRGSSSDRQVANAYIHTGDTRMGFRCGICYLNLQGDQQIELFLGFVIPELRSSNMCAPLEQCAMLGIRGVGHNHPPRERQDAYLLSV